MINYKQSGITFFIYIYCLLFCTFAFTQNNINIADFDVFFLKQGYVPRHEDFSALDHDLSTDIKFFEDFKAQGKIRIIINDSADRENVKKFILQNLNPILQKHGLKNKIEVIFVPINFDQTKNQAITEVLEENKLPAEEKPSELKAEDTPEVKVKSIFKNFFRALLAIRYIPKVVIALPGELIYIGKTLYKSIHRPSWPEIVSGIGSKAYPFTVSFVQFIHAYYEHPIALTAAITLSFVLDTFHGCWVSSWLDFQDKLKKERGGKYQTIFNWAYGQWWGISFRTIAYLSGVSKDWVLSWNYIIPVFTTSLIGSAIGSRAYQGLNKLYELGVYSKYRRDFTQLYIRDTMFMIAGTQLGLGNMIGFWGMFTAEQGLGIYFWIKGELSSHRPMLLIVPKDVAKTQDFALMFPNAIRTDPIPEAKKLTHKILPLLKKGQDFIFNLFSSCTRLFLKFQ